MFGRTYMGKSTIMLHCYIDTMGCGGRDRMVNVVAITTAYAISVYHH
jgi:hypothetical protein